MNKYFPYINVKEKVHVVEEFRCRKTMHTLNSAREMQPLSTCFYVEQAQHNTSLLLRQAVAKRK